MEIYIFRRILSQDIFKDQVPFKYIKVDNICSLKNDIYGNFQELDNTKNKLDNLDKNLEKIRRAASKYLNEYELVKIICKKKVISRAYFKLYEIIYNEGIILKNDLDCFFICEAPGGFIECVTDIRRKKNLRTHFTSVSKYNESIKYSNYLDHSNLLYGDITNISVIENIIKVVLQRFPNKLDLITADGGFDVKVFLGQEIITGKLILCEIYIATQTQKIGGTFIVKFFDMFCHNTIVFFMILCTCYDHVKIIKPKTSRGCNSERYIICYNFKGIDQVLTNTLKNIIVNYNVKEEYIILFPNIDFNCFEEIKRIKLFNNLIINEQIKICLLYTSPSPRD